MMTNGKLNEIREDIANYASDFVEDMYTNFTDDAPVSTRIQEAYRAFREHGYRIDKSDPKNALRSRVRPLMKPIIRATRQNLNGQPVADLDRVARATEQVCEELEVFPVPDFKTFKQQVKNQNFSITSNPKHVAAFYKQLAKVQEV